MHPNFRSTMEMLLALKDLISADYWASLGLLALFLVVFAETGLMVGFFLPGDSLLFTTGVLAASTDIFGTGPWVIWTIVGTLVVAAILGDQTGYLIGQRMGPALFRRPESRFFKPRYVTQTQAFYDRHGAITIVVGRFVPIVRTFAPVLAGVARLRYPVFLTYNVLGGIIWVCSMTLSGYYLSRAIPGIKSYIHIVVLGIVALSVVPVVVGAWRAWRSHKAKTHGG